MLEIQKTKTTFNISVLKVIFWMVLVFWISNFSINKDSQGRKFCAKKIPTLLTMFPVKPLERIPR
jgi:hypothetical protein